MSLSVSVLNCDTFCFASRQNRNHFGPVEYEVGDHIFPPFYCEGICVRSLDDKRIIKIINGIQYGQT